ncbi:MAG TPA: peptidase M3, partial [Porphyromonadaceae bacterium]|nr:peptidase M3 [Porphyromonadaceae bacterium]
MALLANPLLEPFDTPRGTAPFHKITLADYEPAFEEAIRLHNEEIKKIVQNSEPATFSNTVEALERSGNLLARIEGIFFSLVSADSNEEIMKLEEKMYQLLTEHANNIMLNEELFQRVKEVYEHSLREKKEKGRTSLTTEQETLLEKTYVCFKNSGATLSKEDKEKYRNLDMELSRLNTIYGQNVLKDTYAFELLLSSPEELKGLPERELEAAKTRAKQKEKEGYLFDLSAPSYEALMKHSENRELRKKMYIAYRTRCLKGDSLDNREIVKKITALRIEIANLLGYPNYAEYVLRQSMAKTPQKVYSFLDTIYESYFPQAQKEVQELKEYASKKEGKEMEIMPWDWSYYSEKLKTEKFDLNDEMLKPYFELSSVIKGVFSLANELYGLTFKRNEKIPVYHPEVEAYEVFDKDGKYLAVFYTDFFPREGKAQGAWSTEFKKQWKENGEDSRSHQSIVMNFTRPVGEEPALLTYYEVETLMHEFGHALHGILSNTTYASLYGTSVYVDFVELPSQLMENWLSQEAFLNKFFKHYKTGEKIPKELIQKVKDAENFNVGYACIRQLSFAYLDLAWHTLTKPYEGDFEEFEKNAMAKTQLFPWVENTAMGSAFTHIFSNFCSYSSKYYSYKWSEALDADAFSVFQKNGIFDKKTASSFRENVLSRGGSEDPAILYKRFRGQEPTIDALL